MKKIKKNCLNCNNEFETIAREVNRGYGKFCSISCSSIFTKRIQKLGKILNTQCAKCGIEFYRNKTKLKNSKHNIHFCSRKCKDEAQRIGGISAIQPPHYKDGLSKYRERAFRAYGKVCKVCEYNKLVQMLEVDHIDSNRKHNEIDNLMVLCVWCHAFKTRFGRLPVKDFETYTYR